MKESSKQMGFSNPLLNLMELDEIKQLQEEKLRRQLKYCYNNSEFYKEKFDDAGAKPEDIKTIEDFRKLPVFMIKDDERKSSERSLEKYNHPFGLHLCAPVEDLVLTGTTSGTTGNPTFTYTFTDYDIKQVNNQVKHMLACAGIKKGDRILFVFPLGVYATSMMLPGIRDYGALPIDIDIRVGTDVIFKMWELTKPTAVYSGPSIMEYYINLVQEKMGKPVKELGIKALLLSGEMGCSMPEVKKKVETAYGARWYEWMAQGVGPWSVTCDCDEYHGMHAYAPDYALWTEDLVDPETKEPIEIKNGAIGEFCITHLDKKACPFIRYAYGDIVQIFTDPCPNCGFRGTRVKVLSRADDMLTVKGVNVFPAVIRTIVSSFQPKVTGEMRIVLDTPPPRVEQLKIKLEYGQGMENNLENIAHEIRTELKNKLRVSPELEWCPAYSIQRALRKPPTFEKRY